jgi:hypothetical protein
MRFIVRIERPPLGTQTALPARLHGRRPARPRRRGTPARQSVSRARPGTGNYLSANASGQHAGVTKHRGLTSSLTLGRFPDAQNESVDRLVTVYAEVLASPHGYRY